MTSRPFLTQRRQAFERHLRVPGTCRDGALLPIGRPDEVAPGTARRLDATRPQTWVRGTRGPNATGLIRAEGDHGPGSWTS